MNMTITHAHKTCVLAPPQTLFETHLLAALCKTSSVQDKSVTRSVSESMVKEFRLFLATPPLDQGGHIAANSDVTGHVRLESAGPS